MKIVISIFLTLIFYGNYYGQNIETTVSPVDSLHLLIKTSKPKEKIDHFLNLSEYYGQIDSENLDSIRHYAHQALQLSQSLELPEKSIEASYNLGRAAFYAENYKEATTHIMRVLSESEKLDYGEGLRKGNDFMGQIRMGEEKYLEGLSYYEKAYRIAKEYNAPESIVFDMAVDLSTEYMVLDYIDAASKLLVDDISLLDHPDIPLESKGIFYTNLALVHEINENYEEALTYYKQSIDIYKEDHNKIFQIAPLQNIANIYVHLENYTRAIDLFKQALNLADSDVQYMATSHYGLGYCHLQLKEYDNALFYLEKAVQDQVELNNGIRQAFCLMVLGDLSIEQNNSEKAEAYFNKAYQLYQNSIDHNIANEIKKEEISNAYFYLSKIDSSRNNYKKSLDHYKKHTIYKDSISEERNIKIAERLEFAKTTAEKDKEIAQLEDSYTIQELKVKQQRVIQIGLFIVLLFVFILLGVLFNRFRLKQKALKIINGKNEENKLLMREIHHRVKNNLQIILSLLGAQINKHKANTELENALLESQNKIKSMAFIHQNLYQGSQFTMVDVNSYTKELIHNIQESFEKNDSRKVQFEMDVDSKLIKIGLAVPLGLIINELVTNCYKYAFPDTSNDNKIRIAFKQTDIPHTFRLVIEDNGQGLPKHIDPNNVSSFGMQLVKGLVEQLQGKMEIKQQQGTQFDITLEESLAV